MTKDEGMKYPRRPLGRRGKFVIRRSSCIGNKVSLLAMVAASMVALLQPLRAEEWLRRDGQTFEARFIRLQGTAVVFTRDSLEFAVPIFALSPASLEKARRAAIRPSGGIPATRVARVVPVTPLPEVASFSYGSSILSFCRDNLGRKIGTGQCASLASAALRNSGAAIRGGPDWPAQGDYVWGDPVACIQASFGGLKGTQGLLQVEAGDIVQFHDTRFAGYNHSDGGIYLMKADHHTAVVESVDPARKSITVLHQNWNGKMIVRRQTLFLRGMTHGWLRFYHPVPATG